MRDSISFIDDMNTFLESKLRYDLKIFPSQLVVFPIDITEIKVFSIFMEIFILDFK